MKLKQVIVFVIAILVAWCIIQNPPMMAGTGHNVEPVLDFRRMQDYLCIDALIAIILLVLTLRESAAGKATETLCPRCQEIHPGGVRACADGLLPVPAEPTRSAYWSYDPAAPEYRRTELSPRALMIPVVVAIALVLMGCLLYINNLQAQPERPSAGSHGSP